MNDAVRSEAGRDHGFKIAVVAVVVSLALTTLILNLGSDRFSANFANVMQIIAPAIAVAASVRAANRAEGRGWRIGWWMIAASCLSWALGQVVWTWFETIRGQPTPFPSAADFFYLAAIPLAVGGLLAMPTSDDDRRDRARVVLDGMIVAASLLFVSWITVLGPTLAQSSGGWLERAIALAYPAGDVIIITMVIVACLRSDAAGRVAIGLTGLGFVSFALADSLFVYTTLRLDWVSNVSNQAWVAGYLLIALGALHARRHPPSRVSLLTPKERSSALILLPYLPVAIVLCLSIANAVTSDPIVVGRAEFWIGATLIVLLLVRQGFVIMENSNLTRSLARSNESLQYQLLHDALTGLPSRNLFFDRLQGALARVGRTGGALAVMFVDLDLFKQANDTYGHDAGDEVLITVGKRLQRTLRKGDTVARFGGDEYLVLCEDVTGRDEASKLAGRLVEAINRPIRIGEQEIVVQASVGLTLTDDPGEPPEDIVSRADRAMYEAKHKGRARVEVVDPIRRPVTAS
ncbi:MAG TPA: GGDEF domain-containing protein [Acidimicrobiales bacterium]|nr:GGDEF domain-containing protein [Acidimicrobiales bacterium]